MTPRIFLWFLLPLAACSPPPSARSIVQRAIEVHGGHRLMHARVSFDFREYRFTVTRQGGLYSYERAYLQNGSHIVERLSNTEVTRHVDGTIVPLTHEERRSMLTPLNSVPYFALLPFNLQDPAVQLAYLGGSTIRGAPYHEIEVTFRQEDGGRDFDDRFVYWFHKQTYTMDYLAYAFHTDDGGTRFREAFNVRTVAGVRFADYRNYISDTLGSPNSAIERYDTVFDQGAVSLLSNIVTENISVSPIAAAE